MSQQKSQFSFGEGFWSGAEIATLRVGEPKYEGTKNGISGITSRSLTYLYRSVGRIRVHISCIERLRRAPDMALSGSSANREWVMPVENTSNLLDRCSANPCARVRVPPSPITSRVPSLRAAYRMPGCHGRRTDCLPVPPLESTYARCDHRRTRSTHPLRAS
jgi:hypothetical protein